MNDLEINTAEELKAIQTFKESGEGLKARKLLPPSPPQAIRLKLGLTQETFAALLSVSIRTLQNWEQGVREPRGPVLSLLRIAENHPEAFLSLPTEH